MTGGGAVGAAGWLALLAARRRSLPVEPASHCAARTPARARRRPSQAPDSADQVLEGFSHYVTNDGVRRSRVQADTAFFYEGTQITNLSKSESPSTISRARRAPR